MGEIKFITGFAMVILFAIVIVSFAVNFASDNETTISLGDDDDFSTLSSNLQGNVTTFKSDTDESSLAFSKSEVTEGDETTRTGGQFKVGIGSVTSGIKSVFTTVQSKIFGNDPSFGIIFTFIISLFVYVGFRYVWKTWKGGNPD